MRCKDSRRKLMKEFIKDAKEPWGAFAALKELEEQCSHIPVSIFESGTGTILFFTTLTIAFGLNDVLNSDNEDTWKYWAPLTMICGSIALYLLFWIYKVSKVNPENTKENSKQTEIDLRSINIIQPDVTTQNPILKENKIDNSLDKL